MSGPYRASPVNMAQRLRDSKSLRIGVVLYVPSTQKRCRVPFARGTKALALAHAGGHLGELLADKANGPYRHRDLAVWMQHSKLAADRKARLPAVEDRFETMITALLTVFRDPAS